MFYTPPDGYIDQPFFWCFDTDDIADASSPSNIAISLPGGYDFLFRRLTGMDSVLNASTGQFMFRMGNAVRNFANLPLDNCSFFTDFLPTIETAYPETGQISFDLYNTLQATLVTLEGDIPYGQIAFQGVRRRKGTDSTVPGRAFRRVPYNLKLPINLNWSYFSSQKTRKFSWVIDNFDYEAHGLYWTVDYPGIIQFTAEPPTAQFTFAQTSLTSAASLVVVNSAPNQLLDVTVVGTVVTITIATNGGGGETSTYADVLAAFNANAAAVALFTASYAGSAITLANWIDDTYAATATLAQTLPQMLTIAGAVAKFNLFDYAGNGLMPVPMRIGYLNEPLPYGALSAYKSGALQPCLVYPKDSGLAIELTSMIPSTINYTLNLHVIGMQRIPC